MKPGLAAAAALLLGGMLAACGPVMRVMAGGSKNAAAGVWRTEPTLPGLARIALNPLPNGDGVAVQYDVGLTCQHSDGTIRGNRISFVLFSADAAITIESGSRATLTVPGGPPPNSVRLRKVSSERSMVCE